MSRTLYELLSHPPSNIAFSWSSSLHQPAAPLTYGEVQRIVQERAAIWTSLSVSKRQRVLILDTDPVEQILSVLTASHLHLVFTILPNVPEQQKRQILHLHQPHYFCTKGELTIENQEHPLCPPSVAAIFYTSGTSGVPVGVMHTATALLSCAEGMVAYLNLSSRERSALILPLAFHYGFSILSSTLLAGGEIYFTTIRFPLPFLEEMIKQRCSLLAGVPHFWTMLAQCLVEQPLPLTLRALVNAGDQCPSATLHHLHRALPNADIHLLYGSTEVLRSCHHQWNRADKSGVVGRAVERAQIALIDENNALNPSIGELIHWGPTVGVGYWNSAQSLHVQLPWNKANSIYRTGDQMKIDSDGLLYFLSRSEDLLKIAGRRVSPLYIEEHLNQDPRVRESAVFMWNDELTAVMSLHQSGEVEDLLRELPPAYRPKQIHFVFTPLPRTPRGKFSRLHIAQQLCEPHSHEPDRTNSS